ncbi:MAG: hypothetical protein DHS20C21_10860 [Gemmatimonadota bacterium]|nr:MAG: hypothetical protein DHS20C21_10860 [Gemmatimonadota bacterium]
MLFAPPLPPVRIDESGEVVIGRSPDCDLTIDSTRASRCHAAVRTEAGKYFVQDLGSTNGTYVNGARLEAERELVAGDRITVGDEAITFYHVDSAIADVVSAVSVEQTMIASVSDLPVDGEPTQEALSGDFDQIPPFAVLQILEIGEQTGVLRVKDDASRAALWLVQGRPVHAAGPELEGFDAAVRIARSKRGSFHFEPRTESESQTIDGSVTNILMEAMRIDDEGS